MKLVFVDRKSPRHPCFFNGRDIFPEPRAVETPSVDLDRTTPLEVQASVFFCEDNQTDTLMELLAQANPGCEISAYDCVASGICPPSEFVKKRVTKDGVLPA